MKVPQGFEKQRDTRIYKLHKSLYGLRQTSRNWYYKFMKALISIDFLQSNADHSFLMYKRDGNHVFTLIYVDDVILASKAMSLLIMSRNILMKNSASKIYVN